MDPVIKRIIVDAPAPLPPKSARVFAIAGFAVFVGAVIYAKHVAPRGIEAKVAKEMFGADKAAAGAHH